MIDSNKKLTWTDLKALVSSKELSIQYTDQTSYYYVYVVENDSHSYTNISKTTPSNTDQTDFETNYLATANDKIYNRTSVHDGSNNAIISTNSQLHVSDVLNNSGTQGAITVTTTAVAARVGGSNLTNRKLLTVFNNDSQPIYWGYTSEVTTSTGTPIYKDQLVSFEVGPNTTVFLIGSGSNNIRITEAA